MVKKVKAVIAALAAVSLLAACGGGDSATDTPDLSVTPSITDGFVGNWARACLPRFYGAGTSIRDRIVLSKTGDLTLGVSDIEERFNNESCSGTPSTSTSVAGSFALGAAVTASGTTAYRIDATTSGRTVKQLIAASGSSLFVGNFESTKDGLGYPTTLEADPYRR